MCLFFLLHLLFGGSVFNLGAHSHVVHLENLLFFRIS